MKGTEVTIMSTREKINAFVQKLALWKRKAIKNNFVSFPSMDYLLENK